ncbi:hypothetical protein GCM10010515_71930 [Streptomyces fructofermentans]|uniref:Uncharacterized protein n=2 Tax=Streptomyces fructofermentans TaxID=152141 RepID=A0A918U4X0_9ACTN|nr:hypothetical protein GCM10010515_71930 [Streptomyces fructofermentans]
MGRRPQAVPRWRVRLPAMAVVAGVLVTGSACQPGSGAGHDDDRPPGAVRWRSVPQARLPGGFLGFEPRQVLATTDEFIVSGTSEQAGVRLYGSKGGVSWYRADPGEGFPGYAAAHGKQLVLAGQVSNGGALVPAVWRTRDARRWKDAEVLPGGVASDEVLAVSAGPRGAVVVAHDGGPFSEGEDGSSGYRGESLRLWTARDGGPFGQPRQIPCPASPEYEPQVAAVADAEGFVVTANCTNGSGYIKRLVVASADGGKWRAGPAAFRRQSTMAGVSGARGSVLVTRTESSGANPGVFASTLWSRRSGESAWARGRPLDVGEIPDSGVAPRDQQSINAVSAVSGGFFAAGRSLDLRRGPVGALWASPDGRRWTKQATRSNGFDSVFDLYGAAEVHGRFILLGDGQDAKGGARLWLGRYGTRPPAQSSSGIAPFARTWSWGHGSLTIGKTGGFTYRWRLFRDCDTEPAPCDTATVWGGRATGTLKTVGNGTLRGRLSTTNAPDDPAYRKGAVIEVKRKPYSAVHVRVDGKDHGYFCAAGAEDSRCTAPHE